MLPIRTPAREVSPFVIPPAFTGIFLALAAYLSFSTGDALVKFLAEKSSYPTNQILFFNALFGMLPPLCLSLFRKGGVKILRTPQPVVHFIRGVISGIGGALVIYAFSKLPLTDVYVVIFSTPLFVTILASLVLKERIRYHRWGAVLFGFVGVIIATDPSGSTLSLATFAALGGALCSASSVIIVRKYKEKEQSALSFSFYTNMTIVLLTGSTLLFSFTVPTFYDFLLFILMGLLVGIGAMLIPLAIAVTSPVIIAPFQYSQLIWGTLYGYLIFHSGITWSIVTGGIIIIASGLYILYREVRKRPKKQESQPQH